MRFIMNGHYRLFRRLTMALLALYWVMLFVGTHLPGHLVHMDLGNDKIVHFGAFAGLSFLLVWALAACRPSLGGVLAAVAIVVVYGALDELTQAFVPNRTCDIWDWTADAAGALAGLAAYGISLFLSSPLCVAQVRNGSVATPNEVS